MVFSVVIKNFKKKRKKKEDFKHVHCLQDGNTSVRSSGSWKMSRISSGVFPSINRASARLVRSTSGLSCKLSAADVNSHMLLVSILMNFSSKNFLSYIKEQHDVKCSIPRVLSSKSSKFDKVRLYAKWHIGNKEMVINMRNNDHNEMGIWVWANRIPYYKWEWLTMWSTAWNRYHLQKLLDACRMV